MLELTTQHLPVMDDGRLVGLVDMVAVCRALLDGERSG
jgi:CBS domain-containing protein